MWVGKGGGGKNSLMMGQGLARGCKDRGQIALTCVQQVVAESWWWVGAQLCRCFCCR